MEETGALETRMCTDSSSSSTDSQAASATSYEVHPNSTMRIKASGRDGPFSLVLLFSLGLLLLPTTAMASLAAEVETARHFQVCSDGAGAGRLVTLPTEPPECKRPVPGKHPKTANVTVYTPTGELPSSTAYRCVKIVHTMVTSMNFIGQGDIKRDYETRVAAGLNECWDIIGSKKFTVGADTFQLDKVNDHTWVTSRILKDEYSYCCHNYEIKLENFEIVQGEISQLLSGELFSDLGDVSGCKLTDLQCAKSRHIIVWPKKPLNDYCPFKKSGTYGATVFGDSLIIPELQSAVTLRNGTDLAGFQSDVCLPDDISLTNEGPILVIEEADHIDPSDQVTETPGNSSARRVRRDAPTGRSGIDLAFLQTRADETVAMNNKIDPVNVKLHYLYAAWQEEVRQRFLDTFDRLCELARNQRMLQLQIARIDPTQGARMITGRQDVAASLHGNFLRIVGCRKLNITHLYADHRLPKDNTTCYAMLPAKDADGLVWFITPGSNDVAPYSPTENCNYVDRAIIPEEAAERNGTDEYHRLIGQSFINELFHGPHSLSHRYINLTFSAPPLMRERTLYPSSTWYLYNRRLREMDDQLSATIRYVGSLYHDSPAIIRALEDAGKGTVGGLNRLMDRAGHWAAPFLHRMLSWIGFVLALLVLIAVIGGCCYMEATQKVSQWLSPSLWRRRWMRVKQNPPDMENSDSAGSRGAHTGSPKQPIEMEETKVLMEPGPSKETEEA